MQWFDSVKPVNEVMMKGLVTPKATQFDYIVSASCLSIYMHRWSSRFGLKINSPCFLLEAKVGKKGKDKGLKKVDGTETAADDMSVASV